MTRLSAQALLDRALEYSRAGQYDEALAHYAQLMHHFPGESVAHYNRGCLYERLGKLDLALADFQEAYRLDPDEEDYRHNLAAGHFNRGLRYHKQGKDDLALADFREACRLNPDEPDYRQALATASYNRGIDYGKGGDDARALIAFEEALRINPGNADYLHNVAATRHSLGVCYFKKQDYEHAKAEFQEALRLCPKNKVYRQCLAATEHNLRLGARTRDDEADAVPLGREQRSALDDEDTNPRIKRHLAAVPVTSSWPGQPAGYSNPDEKPVFSGDGDCPKCRALLWIDWKLNYDMMACPGCRFEFDGEAAISIVTSHEPGKNSGNFERVREAIRMKKDAVIQQMRSEQPPQLPAPPAHPDAGRLLPAVRHRRHDRLRGRAADLSARADLATTPGEEAGTRPLAPGSAPCSTPTRINAPTAKKVWPGSMSGRKPSPAERGWKPAPCRFSMREAISSANSYSRSWSRMSSGGATSDASSAGMSGGRSGAILFSFDDDRSQPPRRRSNRPAPPLCR
jgi:Tfp pilus assembly protein PilF